MASITDDPSAFFDNLTKTPEPKTPEPSVEKPQEDKKETKSPSVTEDPSAFFDSLTPKPQEQEKPVSAVDEFAAATQGLEPENFDKDYLGMMSTWSPQEWHDFKKIRPDYPIPADKQREVFDAERAGLIKKEQSGGSLWDETKRLLRGAGKFAGQMFEEPAEDASEEDIKAHAVNTLNALKSFNAPVMELPGELATTATKIGLGGTKYTDQLSEKYGFSTPEDSFRRYQARESVDTANALLNRTSPTVYSKMLFHPYVQEGLKSLIKLNAPGIDDGTAYKGAQEVAQDVAKSQAPIDEDIKTAGSWLSPAGLGFGEMGFAGNVIGAGAGIPGLVRGLSMSKAAQQALEQAATAARVEKASQLGMLGSAAKKFADTTEGLQQAAAEFAQNRPIMAAVGTAALKDLPGAVIGYGEDKEHPLRGALLGAIVEHTALGALGKLKGLEAVTQIPRTLADLAEAKAVSAGGRKGMFELAGANPEASQLTQTLFKNGKIYDKLGNLIKDYGREGVNMGALGVATGALNSQDADELADSLKSGIGFGVFAKALHGALRQDPSAHQREIRQTDADIYKTMQQLSPETQENIRQLQDWKNVVRTHPELANADVATRQAYAREIGKMINTMHETVNGPFRAGQKNIGVEILSTPQIVDRMVAQNPDKTPAELQQIAETGAGLYFPTGGREFVPGESIPTALQAPMTRVTFDPMKPTAVVNIDKVADFAKAQNVSFADALRHEFGHALDDIPEFRELNAQTDKLLFDSEDRGLDGKVYQSTKGLFSNKDLVDRFFNEYLSGEGDKAAKEQWAKDNQLWDTVNDRPNEKAIVDYMKKEVRADLNASSFTGHNLKSLDSVQQHLLDWATLNRQNSIVARAVDKYMGNGGRDPFAATPSVATGAQFTPEVLSAHRNAVRQLQKLNGMVSTPTAGESVAPMITKAKLIGNKALRERYGRDSGLFKTEFRATVFDANGNVVGQTVLTDPMAKEGLWGNENGTLNQRSGYGEAPAGVQVPEGGSLKVSREIVMGPDGETPQMLSPKEIKQLVKTRADLIRDALDTAYQGEPEGFRPVSEDRLSYRGTFTPAQIAAIRALPEQIVPAKVKESILRFNDLLARGDGNRMLIDYAARVDDRGRAVSFSPKIYDLVPIGMHFSKDGNFLITTVSVTRLLNKLDLWADRLPGRLAPWGGNREAFFREFAGKYLQNHLAGKPGETGLDPDPKVALEKKNIFNDFLNLTNNDARSANPDRTVIPRKKGDPKGKYADRTIMSVRADSIADMLESTAPPLPVDYGKQLMNFLPAREGKATEEPKEENNPILKALNAVKATYVAPDQRTPYAQPARNANEDVQRISENYVKNAGMEYRPHGQAVPVNEELAKRIADHYEEAKNDPNNPEVKKAYTALANEVVDQWKAFEKAGYTATPWTGEGQPYANSAEMMKDVRDNKHLYYFQTKDGYGESGITPKMRAENPMLQDSGVNFQGAENVPVNDVFRVVHDIVGHGAHGYEFGPKGEFNAYLEHSRMFSDAAKPALAAETLAQNSWVNFGPHLRDEEGNIAKKGEKGYVPVTERPFAEQKNIALPQEFIDAAEKEAQAGTKSGPSFLPARIERELGTNKQNLGMPSEEDAKAALDTAKQPKFGAARSLKKGYPVALRIDIPAFNRTGNYVVTVHEAGTPGSVGTVIGYDNIARVDNPQFSVKPGVEKIYQGSAKFPVATVNGDFNPSRTIPKDINEWTPVGFDPKEHSFFYDKATDEVVTGGDQAISVGNTVFVKNPVYGDRSTMSFLPAKKLTVQHPSKEKEGSVGGELDLVHFGAHGLKSADPSKFGKGAATPGDLRGAPKTYFYLNNDRNYEGIMRGRTPYVAKVDGNSIYDLSKDPLGVAGMLNREKMDNMIEDAGYAGYFSPKSYNGAFDAVAMFKKTKLTEVQQGREIFKTPKTSKYFGVNYLPAKMDEAHAKAIESGDTEEAQRLVDEAAKKAGYTIGPVYHYGVFDKNVHGIPNTEKFGMHFGTKEASEDRAVHLNEDIDFTGGQFTKAYLRGKFLRKKDVGGGWSYEIPKAIEKGYDGIVYKNEVEDVGSDSYIIFDPEQAKSADPATYDKEGNLIPLSQRFNPESNDIRYLPAKKGVDEGTQTEETSPTDEYSPESNTQAKGAGVQAGGQSEDDRNRLLGGLASVARGAQSSGAEGVQGASGSASRKEVEEAALRKHAEENGLMRDPDPFFKQWQLDGSEAGGEHQVSFPTGPDVVKRTPNPYYPTWADYFDSLKIHNTLFPKAALTFRGLQNVEGSGGVDIDGNKWPAGLYSEVSQPFLKIKRGLTVPETDAMMKELGFRRTLPMEYVNDELGIKIKDLHGMNAVMLEDENGHEFPYVIDSTIVPTKAKEEQPRVMMDGHVVVTNPEADFVAKPKILVNFLPASQRINLEDYADRPMFALPADRMGVGTKYVGPTGDKKKLSVEAQGGPEHMTLLNKGVWAFTNEGPASTFVNRVNKLAEKHGTDSVLVAVTLQSPINHLKNPTGQLGYVEAMEQARDTKHVTQKQLDAQIKEMSSAIVNSTKKDMDENVRAKWKQITSFSKFADAVRSKKLNFGDMEPLLGQLQRSRLPISAKELAAMGLLPQDIARDLSTDWIFDLPNDTVVGLFEVKKGTRPTQDNTHYSYPWSVAGKPIGFLKDIYHVKGLTTHEGIQKSTSLAWPLQRALPELDNLKKALADLPPVVTYR
jgi:Serine/Threonine/Tyrosine Kinase found in polyvalent proteins